MKPQHNRGGGYENVGLYRRDREMFNNGTKVSVTVGFYTETHTKLKTRHKGRQALVYSTKV